MNKQNKKHLAKVGSNKKAFTLIELIVVITILAILGTIAFISLQGYSSQARDSKRLSDISNIKKSLELFSLNTGKYPQPDDYFTVSYSGEELRYQGNVGEQISTNLSRNLNEKPTDPSTGLEYTYSTTHSQTEYEVLGLYESDIIGTNVGSLLVGVLQTNATTPDYPKIDGNYNGIYVKTSSFYIPTPSIINAEIVGDDDLDNTLIKSQIISGGDNIPGVSTGGIDITFSPYTGTITKNSTNTEKSNLVQAIQVAYSGSQLASNTMYADILSRSSSGELIDFVDIVVLNIMEQTNNVYSCDGTTKPTDNGHISYITGTPIEENQAYQKDAESCGYSCTDGYEGINCDTFYTTTSSEAQDMVGYFDNPTASKFTNLQNTNLILDFQGTSSTYIRYLTRVGYMAFIGTTNTFDCQNSKIVLNNFTGGPDRSYAFSIHSPGTTVKNCNIRFNGAVHTAIAEWGGLIENSVLDFSDLNYSILYLKNYSYLTIKDSIIIIPDDGTTDTHLNSGGGITLDNTTVYRKSDAGAQTYLNIFQ